MTVHAGDDFGFARVRRFAEERDGAEDHAGRAVAALERVVVEEGLLHDVQGAGGGEPFDGGDAFAGGSAGLGEAASGGDAIEEDGAGGALSFAAAELGSSEVEIVAEDAEEGTVG